MLRLETGMHTTAIRHIGVDMAQRYLVTGSEDKTVRVWELTSGRLLRTLRPPIGTGNEGRIYAVTLSPDGSTVAAAGWTGYASASPICQT
jgi:WD40 repeat protein